LWLRDVSGFETAKVVIPVIEKILADSTCKCEGIHALSVTELAMEICLGSGLEAYLTEVLIIAAFAHDIERGYDQDHCLTWAMYLGDYEAYKRTHAWRSAAVITKILKDHGASDDLVEKVRDIVRRHEDGGTPEADIICAADSLSFMKDILKEYVTENSYEQTMMKLNWMFDRIPFEAVKNQYRSFYRECCQWVANYFNPEAE